MGPFNVTIMVMVQKKKLPLNDYGPVTDPVTDPVTMLSRSSHGAYQASLLYVLLHSYTLYTLLYYTTLYTLLHSSLYTLLHTTTL